MMVCPQTAYGLRADWLIDRGFYASKWCKTAADSHRCFFNEL